MFATYCFVVAVTSARADANPFASLLDTWLSAFCASFIACHELSRVDFASLAVCVSAVTASANIDSACATFDSTAPGA